LGFKNIIQINNDEGFKDKYINFAELGLKSKCSYFIRIDGDHFVFDGIFDLLEKTIDENYDWLTGVVHDYVMDNFRGGTPQILSRKVLELLVNDNELMPNRQKPESEYSNNIRNMTKMGDVRILTALHEYEQYPSKVCNSFLNRLYRGHMYLYRNDYLNSLPDYYKKSINEAHSYFVNNRKKESMDFVDFNFLNSNFNEIDRQSFDSLYEKYNLHYQEIKNNFK